ncbi:MAG: bifunctional adenosylcobinamide kinase/adenosylcobinamide-phosphate guanylyltransferase [Evtepia gabavorous]
MDFAAGRRGPGGIVCWKSLAGGAMVLAALLVFWDYWRRSRKYFGGLSGDLAGWFLQRVELWMLAAVWIVEWGRIFCDFCNGPVVCGKERIHLQGFGLVRGGLGPAGNLGGAEPGGPGGRPGETGENLAQYEVVIATEVGGGVVPVDPVQRQNREAAGRLACLLAQRADRVIRVFCGLPQALKGELP